MARVEFQDFTLVGISPPALPPSCLFGSLPGKWLQEDGPFLGAATFSAQTAAPRYVLPEVGQVG